MIATCLWLWVDSLTRRGRLRALARARAEADAAQAEVRTVRAEADKARRSLAVLQATTFPQLGPADDVSGILLTLRRKLSADEYAEAVAFLGALDDRLAGKT